MRERFLIKLAQLAEKRTAIMIIVFVIITLLAGALSEQLKLEMHFRNLMPQSHPMVEEFNKIVDEYSTASMIIIAALGEEQELKQFADDLAPQVKALSNYVQRVEYKIEKDFFLKHGFMLTKAKDLKNNKDIFSDVSLLPWLKHLNGSFEKTYVYDEESISTKEKENNAIRFLDGVEFWLNTATSFVKDSSATSGIAQEAAERFLLGDEYMISQDKDMLLLFAQPTFTVNDIEILVEAENEIDSLIAKTSSNYPSIYAGTTGTVALARDEMVAANEDMYFTSIIALLLIIGLFILSFRMWVAPLLAGITLIIGIMWTAGFAALTVGSLNIMTSMFAVILIGLGVDFSIHIISVFTESRAEGQTLSQALQTALLKSGKGIITGGITTSFAFFTLMISETAGMFEFGVVAGSGVIFCMLATILVLPTLLALRDKMLAKFRKGKYVARSTEFVFLGKMANSFSQRPTITILAATIITVLLFISALNISFDYNYLNMEPVGLTSIKLQHIMEDEFDVTPDFALVTTNSIEDSRRIAKAAKDLKMIGMVTSISDYIPSLEEQEKRTPIIEEMRKSLNENDRFTPLRSNQMENFIDELNRLEANVIEFAQLAFLGGQDKVDKKCKAIIGDLENANNETMVAKLANMISANENKAIQKLNDLQEFFSPHYREIAIGMTSTESIDLNTLPQTIKDQFINDNGDKYLVSIYPKESVWNLEFLERFTDRMTNLDERVTGMPSIFYVLMQIIGKDGKIAAILAIAVIFILLLIDFKDFRFALLAMVPLVFGAIWMIGSMNLLGLQLTLVNVMGLPLILGIGVDDGVHLLHRYQTEGKGKIRKVFMSTGRAVLITSLTTMLAFGSLKFATYRGLGSLGVALFIGVCTCFLSSVILLPALFGLIERKKEI